MARTKNYPLQVKKITTAINELVTELLENKSTQQTESFDIDSYLEQLNQHELMKLQVKIAKMMLGKSKDEL